MNYQSFHLLSIFFGAFFYFENHRISVYQDDIPLNPILEWFIQSFPGFLYLTVNMKIHTKNGTIPII